MTRVIIQVAEVRNGVSVSGKAPTSAEVALRAGVSRSIVSVVLNGSTANSRVSKTTRAHVIAVAEELGYRANRNAQSLRSQRSGVVGFIPRLSRGSMVEDTVPFIMSIELARAAVRRGIHVIEASAETAASREGRELVQFLLDWQVDGVIVDNPPSDREIGHFIDAGLRVVQLFRPVDGTISPQITINPMEGMNEAINHLCSLGHERIAYIGSADAHPVDIARTEAFRHALSHCHLDDVPARLRLAPNYYTAEGYAEMRTLLALPFAERPTAVVIGGDPAAIGALRALYEARIRVPEHMSVISYDDSIAGYQVPPLTSVSQPFSDIANQALAMLAVDRMSLVLNGKEHLNLILPTRLTIRDSTAPPYAL